MAFIQVYHYIISGIKITILSRNSILQKEFLKIGVGNDHLFQTFQVLETWKVWTIFIIPVKENSSDF